MFVMAANAFYVLNSFSYPYDVTRGSLRRTPQPINTHDIINKKNASSRDVLKPKMALDQNTNSSYIVPDAGLGRMVKDGFVFRQNFHIRSYEVGSDQKVTIETLVNLLQETSINHFKAIGIWGDGLGSTQNMCNNNLFWAMRKLQVVVDCYPIWGDVIQIDTWKGTHGKIGMSSNWTISNGKTGEILLTASSILLLMNGETRRLSKIPEYVQSEIGEHLTKTTPPTTRKWLTRDESIVAYVRDGLTPGSSDLDVNQHVNNVKYIKWILESVPSSIVENYELASMTLEYCHECRKENMFKSHTYVMGIDNDKLTDYDQVDCEHVLQLENGGGEIMKGWTTWRVKDACK